MISAIILASGFSRRYGDEKLLLEVNGRPMISLVAETVLESGFDEVVLVYRNEKVKEIIKDNQIRCIYNKHASKGMSASIKCGIQATSNASGYMFFNGDQPYITKEIIHKLLQAFYDKKGSIIVPKYNDQRGNPVIFSNTWKEQFYELSGDIGGRNIIETNKDEVFYVDIDQVMGGIDIDTKEDYINSQK